MFSRLIEDAAAKGSRRLWPSDLAFVILGPALAVASVAMFGLMLGEGGFSPREQVRWTFLASALAVTAAGGLLLAAFNAWNRLLLAYAAIPPLALAALLLGSSLGSVCGFVFFALPVLQLGILAAWYFHVRPALRRRFHGSAKVDG